MPSPILKNKKCVPCQGGVPPLPEEVCLELKKQIHPDWYFTHNKTRLKRDLKFTGMKAPLELAIKIGELADSEWHHPELHLGFGHLEVEVWTHKINNLVESDFIFCAKLDELIST